MEVLKQPSDTVAESVKCRLSMQEIESSAPSQVKTNDLSILYLFISIVWRSALIVQGKDLFSQCQDNVTEQDMDHGGDGLISQWGSTIKSP